jgi:Flp pilus assembly protein TadB
MLIYAKFSFLLLLFALIYLCIRFLLISLIRQRKARYRLQYMRDSKLSSRLAQYLSRNNKLYIHLQELIESVKSRLSMNGMVTISFLLLICGFLSGALYFQSFKGVMIITLISTSLPYLMLRMKLITVRLRTRLEFLPAVEVFYQYYMLSGNKNIKSALKTCLEENRILHPIKPVFEQLYRNLMAGRNTDESLRIFSITLGHVWADYFAAIVKVALTEGNTVALNLKNLITDMRKAQRFDQTERNRLLEIRIANFTPIGFLALFLGINFKVNYANAYHYYVLDSAGRNLLLDALLLIFLSFLMGIFLSLKRM